MKMVCLLLFKAMVFYCYILARFLLSIARKPANRGAEALIARRVSYPEGQNVKVHRRIYAEEALAVIHDNVCIGGRHQSALQFLLRILNGAALYPLQEEQHAICRSRRP